MGRSRDYGKYHWEWEGNTIKITPYYPNRQGITPKFGLGNAEITLNISTPPENLTVPITGETTAQGLLPTSPFKMKRWKALPSGMHLVQLSLAGAFGEQFDIEFDQATDFEILELGTDASINKNGYGQIDISPIDRLNW